MEKENKINNNGCQNILLVDDEDMIVEMFQLMLERDGYNVTACTSSVQALDIFGKNPENFDLVISDFTMPEMTGLELAENINSIRKDIPFILNSGYSENLTDEIQEKFNIQKVLTKPLIAHDLINAINEIQP